MDLDGLEGIGCALGVEDIDWFEAGNDDGDPNAFADRLVLPLTHDGADAAGTEKGLHAVVGRLKNGRGHEDVRN